MQAFERGWKSFVSSRHRWFLRTDLGSDLIAIDGQGVIDHFFEQFVEVVLAWDCSNVSLLGLETDSRGNTHRRALLKSAKFLLGRMDLVCPKNRRNCAWRTCKVEVTR